MRRKVRIKGTMRRVAKDDRVASHELDTWSGKDAGSADASVRMQAGRLCTFVLKGEANKVRKARMEIEEQGRVPIPRWAAKKTGGTFCKTFGEERSTGIRAIGLTMCPLPRLFRSELPCSCRGSVRKECVGRGEAKKLVAVPGLPCRGASIFARTSDAKCAVIPGAEQVVGEWGILRKSQRRRAPATRRQCPADETGQEE